MKKVTEDDLLEAIANEVESKYPQPGEITVNSFMEKMKSKGREMTYDQAAYWLNEQVMAGKLKMRFGIISGRKGRIYSKK